MSGWRQAKPDSSSCMGGRAGCPPSQGWRFDSSPLLLLWAWQEVMKIKMQQRHFKLITVTVAYEFESHCFLLAWWQVFLDPVEICIHRSWGCFLPLLSLAKICLCTMITDGSCWQPTCLTFLVCQQWPGPSVYLYGFRLWSVFLKVWEERRFPLKKSVCFVGTNEWLNVSNQSHFPHAIQRKKYQISIYYMTISNIHWGHIICHTINGARKKVTHTLYSHKCKFTPKCLHKMNIFQ